jgi:putative hydrolase of the HAD superfamily
MAKVLGVDYAEFRNTWSQLRPRRDTGEITTAESAVEVVLDWMGATADAGSIEAAGSIRYRSVQESLVPRPGAIELLKDLRAEGYRLGLLSNCGPEVPELWSETPFADLIDVPVFSASERMVKPTRELYQRVVARLGVAAKRCVYIGDGDSDELDAAAEAGMTAWLILLPHEDPPRDRRHAESADRWRHRHLRSLAEVLGVLDARHS